MHWISYFQSSLAPFLTQLFMRTCAIPTHYRGIIPQIHDYYKTLFLVESHLSGTFIEESVQIRASQLWKEENGWVYCLAPRNSGNGCFKLHRSYSNSFNLSNVGDFSPEELNSKGLYLVHKKKKKIVVLCSRPKMVLVVQRRQRNVQKSVRYVQSCCLQRQ